MSETDWIPVSERLPDAETEVLVYAPDPVYPDEDGVKCTAYLDGRFRKWVTTSVDPDSITHWMPWPDSPEPAGPSFEQIVLDRLEQIERRLSAIDGGDDGE